MDLLRNAYMSLGAVEVLRRLRLRLPVQAVGLTRVVPVALSGLSTLIRFEVLRTVSRIYLSTNLPLRLYRRGA